MASKGKSSKNIEAASETTTTDGGKHRKPTSFEPSSVGEREDEPPNKDSMCLLSKDEVKEPKLQLLDLKNIRFQNMYNSDMEEFKKNIILAKKSLEPKTFKFDILVCFWLSLHLQYIDFARFLMDQDPLLEKILQNLRKTGKEKLAREREKEFKLQEEDDEKINSLRKQLTQDSTKKGMFGGMFNQKAKIELEKLEKQSSLKKNNSLRRMASLHSQHSITDETHPTQQNKTQFTYTDDSVSAPLKRPAPKQKRKDQKASASVLTSPFLEEIMAVIENKTGIEDKEDLADIIWLLKDEAGQTFNTNIMRIALNMQEEKIASIILALYDSKIDDEMVLRAVKTQQLGFIHTMFVYNKNYEELMSKRKFLKLLEMAQADNDPEAVKQAESARFRVFTIDYIIKKVIDYGEEMGKELVEQIAQWKLKSTENILKAMLKNNMDDIALKYVLLYIDYVDTELLAFCILNNNETFLKYCLKNGVYTTLVLSQSTLIDEVLRILKTGTKTELILNVLMYMNLLKWSGVQIKSFIDQLKIFIFENPEKNPITISYNPILVIALACEQIMFIEDNFISIRHDCRIVRNRMLILGDKILDNFDDQMLSKVFLDSDFKERTLLKIITTNKFELLFQNYKVGVILEEIWQGKNTFDCDGEISDLSLLSHLAKTPIKKLKNTRVNMSQLIFNGFSYSNFRLQKYWFQYKFRVSSIDFIFKKDFFSAIGMVVVFQLINFTYLDLFKDKRYEGYAPLGKRALVQSYIYEYNSINFLGTIFSSGLVFNLMQKLLFNCFAFKKMVLDVWTVVDLISAVLNLFCFNVIGSVTVDQLIDPAQKRVLDYYVICVTIVSWLRFFSYFYLIRIVSKLMHTLFRMLKDTTSFIFLILCYLAIMSTIFTMLFQKPDPGRFGSVTMTMRTLFDAFIGQYQYLDDFPNFALSFQLLMIIHVFISNIFLLNYLVAILSAVFSIMTDLSDFQFKCNKYEFIEKYSVPMLEEGYKELVIHPTPLNFFAFPLLFGLVNKGCMKTMGNQFSKVMYWAENVAFIVIFIAQELSLVPVVFFKQLASFIYKSNWKNIFYLIPFWLILGIPITLVIGVMGDLVNLLRVLCDYGQAEEEERIKAEDEFRKDKVILYNELMDVMRAIMHIYKKREEEEKGQRRKMLIKIQKKGNKQTAADFLEQHFLSHEGESQGYVLEKQVIKQAWAKYRPESALPSPREGAEQANNKLLKDRSDLNQVFGQLFIEKLLKLVKQRLYQGRKQFNYEELKRKHKAMVQQQKKDKGGEGEEVQFRNDFLGREHLVDDDPLQNKDIPPQELQLVDEFLQKFIFIAVGGSTSKNQVDINLVLKSLPARIDENNLYRVDMIGFSIIQKALIAFQNDDTDELFIHYDDRNKQRFKKLNSNAGDTEGQSIVLKEISHKLLQIINNMLKRMNVKEVPDTAKSSEIVSKRDPYSNQSTHRFGGRQRRDETEDEQSPVMHDGQSRELNNGFDDIPIQSAYAMHQAQLRKAAKNHRKGGTQSPKTGSIQDSKNPLYMYLPQGNKLKGQQDDNLGMSKKKTSLKELSPEKNQQSRFKKPANQESHVYYPKDYSDYKVTLKPQNSQSMPGSISRAPMRNIYRSGGVNFKVDLHKERAMYGKANGKIKNHLQKLGVGYDLMQEYLSLQGSNSKSNLGNGDLNSVSQIKIEEMKSPYRQQDSLYIFSDNEVGEEVTMENLQPDTHNMSPIGHQFSIQLPPYDLSIMDAYLNQGSNSFGQNQKIFVKPPPSGEGIVKREIQITEQTRSNIDPLKNIHNHKEFTVTDEDERAFESALDAARSLGLDGGSSGGEGTLSGSDLRSKGRKHKPPKVQWFKNARRPQEENSQSTLF